ncbi:MAG: hypothetical protein KIT31_37830 [Deltaproteobacteria bacterium]|nr:hypothetical protein [Deltaproteobacteria bacterium]
MSSGSPDGWYESEEPTRLGMVTELQRIKRRMRARPLPVILLAIVVTAGVTYKFANKPKLYESRIVLALSEGVLSQNKTDYVLFDQLKQYVGNVLLPDAPLNEMIERRNLFPLRKQLGMEFARNEVRGNLEIEIWKNSFVYFDTEDDSNARKSARIGMTYTDGDNVRAYEVARDLATIAIKTHDELQQAVADQLAKDVARAREQTAERLDEIAELRATKLTAADDARRRGNLDLATALSIELLQYATEEKKLLEQQRALAQSGEANADRIVAAGLDISLSIVEERRPEKAEQSELALLIVISVIGLGALLGSALFVGAFDVRIHDADDVQRLNLPVLGHVPGFHGDDVGSLAARGVPRGRVPWFLRWRSKR